MEKYSFRRRTFLKKSALFGAGLMIGFTFDPDTNLAVTVENGETLGLWIRITPDGTTTLIVPSSEMGQGVNTSLSMILGEELDADWQKVQTVTAPANSDYKNPENPGQFTGGSKSVKGFWEPLCEVGAAAREMLKTAAAQKWNVPIGECKTESGQILHSKSGRQFGYGEFVQLEHHKPCCAKMMMNDQFFREVESNCWEAKTRIKE